MRRSTIFVFFMTFIVGFGLFQLKYEVMKLENQHKQVRVSIKASEEAIFVLNAEWSHLTSPERLQKLACKHLDVVPVSGKQLISLRQVAVESENRQLAVQRRFAVNQLVSDALDGDEDKVTSFNEILGGINDE